MSNTSSFNPVADLGAVITLTAAGTGITTSKTLTNNLSSGVCIVINITAESSATFTVTVQGVDAASGAVYPVGKSSSITAAVETMTFTVYPTLSGAGTTPNFTAQGILSNFWNIAVDITAGTMTATIGACLLA